MVGKIILIGLALAVTSCDVPIQKENLRKKDWYRYAEEYIRYDKILLDDAIAGRENFIENYNHRHTSATKLVKTVAPSRKELSTLLFSTAILDRKVALVNMMSRKNFSQEFYATVVDLLNSETDYFLRFYCYHNLKMLDSKEVQRIQADIINIIEKEDIEPLLVTAMPTLIKIDSEKIVDLFVKYLGEGSDGLKAAAYVYLGKINQDYREKIIEKSGDSISEIREQHTN